VVSRPVYLPRKPTYPPEFLSSISVRNVFMIIFSS
jgi:hypothetical protein